MGFISFCALIILPVFTVYTTNCFQKQSTLNFDRTTNFICFSSVKQYPMAKFVFPICVSTWKLFQMFCFYWCFSKLINSTKCDEFYFPHFQALCGVVFEVPTLTGDKLRISTMQEVIKPNTVKRITGYGLPLPKDPTRKGDMLVAFDIKFPEKLSASEKELLSDVLPSA